MRGVELALEDIVVIVVVLAMDAVYVFGLIRWLLRKGLPWLFALWSRLTAFTFGRAAHSAAEDDPEVHRQVVAVLSRRRVQCAHAAFLGLWSTSCCFCGTFVLRFLVHDTFYSRMFVLLNVGALVALTLTGAFMSRLIKEGSLPIAHVVAMVFICTALFVDMPKDISTNAPSTFLMLSTAGSLLCLRLPILMVTNSCALICSVVRLMRTSSTDELRVGLLVQGANFLLKMSVLYAVEFALKASAKKEVAAMHTKCQQAAVSSLLDMLCDAVVELDEGLKMKQHFPKLGVMLMQGVGKSLQGSSLAEFMPDDHDKTRFADAVSLCAGHDGEPKPTMLNVRMRDSMGNRMKVELFHVPYINFGGQMHHLVGVREDSDDGAAGRASAFGAREAILREDIVQELKEFRSSEVASPRLNGGGADGVVNARRCSHSGSSGRRTSNCGTRSSGSDAAASNKNVQAPDMDRCIIVSTGPGLPVSFATEGALEDLGLEAGALTAFGDLMPDGGQRLSAWLSSLARKQASSGGRGEVNECFGSVELRRAGRGSTGAMRRTLWVYIPEAVGGAAASRVVVVLSRGTGSDDSTGPAPRMHL